MEGGPKLQCKKPVSEEARARHLARLRSEVLAFLPELARLRSSARLSAEAARAEERSKGFLRATA